MGYSRNDEDSRADHYHDSRKHDFEPLPRSPIDRLTPPIATALEIAVLVKGTRDIREAAKLVEQYANTVASGAALDATNEAYARIDKVLTGAGR